MKRTLSSASAKTVFTSEISTEIFNRLKLSIEEGKSILFQYRTIVQPVFVSALSRKLVLRGIFGLRTVVYSIPPVPNQTNIVEG
jgi:hypothetical protein